MTEARTTPPAKPAFVRNGLRPLAAAEAAVHGAFASRGFDNPLVVLRWREFAGPVLGRLTAPIALSAQGQLTISADPSVAILLQHQTQTLIQRINMALGSTPIAKIKVVSGKFQRTQPAKSAWPLTPSQRAWADQTTQGVADPSLKTALSRLAHAIAAAAPTALESAPLRPKS